MNKTFTKAELATWIAGLMVSAEDDEHFDVAWFKPTQKFPYAIVGGWLGGYYPGVNDDLFCTSKSEPTYSMCVKICINNGPYAYADFETLDMPTDESGEVDNNCITLEWDDNPEMVAEFFMAEWERITEQFEVN